MGLVLLNQSMFWQMLSGQLPALERMHNLKHLMKEVVEDSRKILFQDLGIPQAGLIAKLEYELRYSR